MLTIASAIRRISVSLMLQPNVFQLFQPIGGVRATPLSSACAAGAPRTARLPDSRSTPEAMAVFQRFSFISCRLPVTGEAKPRVSDNEISCLHFTVAVDGTRGRAMRTLTVRFVRLPDCFGIFKWQSSMCQHKMPTFAIRRR